MSFGRKLRERPLAAIAGLTHEYVGYLAACLFIVFLVATRVPLAFLDRTTGLRLRERFIELISRVSPG